MQRQLRQAREVLAVTSLAEGEDIHFPITDEELVDESAIGQGRDRKAEAVRIQPQLGSTRPIRANLDQRLIQR